jgi:salicylate hydroxylase
MATARSVAIIGGGIGGLAIANSLMRIGMSVSLYERSPYFIPIAGAGFSLQPNGQISLAYIGFQEQAEKIIHPFLKWQLINDNGKVLSTSNRLGEYGKRFGYFLGGALRADLVDILKKPLEKTNTIHYSHKMININQDVDGVIISFENEKQQKPIRVDMVIGADGINSTVTQLVFSPTAPSMYSKESIFYGIINNIDQQTSINPSVTQKNTLTQYFGRGEFISYRVGNQGQFMWAATYPSDVLPQTNNDIEWAAMNNQRELNRLLSRFPQSHPVHQCAAATDKQRLLHFGLYYCQHRSGSWHRDRVCLLGDSCHATLPYVGQGANMAIEDGIALALCLEKHNFQMELAFQKYYKRRFNRTKRVADMARYMGLFFHAENPIVHSIRQRLIPWLMNSNMMIKIAEKELYENCPVPIEHKRNVK